jgi:hypothetical protein
MKSRTMQWPSSYGHAFLSAAELVDIDTTSCFLIGNFMDTFYKTQLNIILWRIKENSEIFGEILQRFDTTLSDFS